MILPFWNPVWGKLRVAGLASGSGNTLWKALDLQRELERTWEGSPFEVVALFSDSPDAKCVATAAEYGIPCESVGIRAFYEKRGAPLKDREVRREYDGMILEKLSPYRPDLILLAGYVWATTDAVTKSILTVGVHPADLSIVKNGKRAYAGSDGVGSTLAGGEREIRASSYLATPEIDGGPILIVSPAVPVNPADGLEGRDRVRYYLAPVNDQGRVVGARTVLEIALGHFCADESGKIYHNGRPVPLGVKFDVWDQRKPLYQTSVRHLLEPRSLAVVGASARPGLGNAVLKNIVDCGFKGKIWAVNRGGDEVWGVPGFQSVSTLPEAPDMVMVTVPGEAVCGVVEQCGERGVKAVTVLSAGFKELGGKGNELERRLMEIVRRYNMRLLGPNCMGLVNTKASVRLNANMLQTVPCKGSVSLVTQSGAIGSALIDFSETFGIGFSVVVSTGNQPDININDLIPYLCEDEDTRVILAYLETIPEPGRFIRVLSKAAAVKPVVLLKSGRTSVGAQAASSHTGSLAGDNAIAETLMEKTGTIVVRSLEEAFLLGAALSKMPRFSGKRVGVVSNAGGPGTLIADALSEAGFELPLMSRELRDELAASVMPQASTSNPLDLVATALPEHYSKAVELMLESGIYDALILMVVPPVGVDTGAVAAAVAEPLREAGIPVVSCFFGPSAGERGRRVMLENGIPSFAWPEQTVVALRRMLTLESHSEAFSLTPPALTRMEAVRDMLHGEGYLSQTACERLLSEFGLPVARSQLVSSAEACRDISLRYPVVAKIEHPNILHKSDVGGVVLNLSSPEALGRAVKELLLKFDGADGVRVQEQVGPGLELILGANSDPGLGHVLMVGLGGVGVELYKDVAVSHVPFDRAQARKMLQSLRCAPILWGYRGAKGVDVEGLIDLTGKVQQLLLRCPRIGELDLNPVIWDGTCFTVADCRIRVW